MDSQLWTSAHEALPQKTPRATPQWPWRLCWSSMATADIAPHSLFILSAPGRARFTYSPLHSLPANRLWTSRLSIMEGSLTVLWQAHWIDSSGRLFIFAGPASPLLDWVRSFSCSDSRSDYPSALLPPNPSHLSLSLHTTADTDKITGAVFPSCVFNSYFLHAMTMSYKWRQLVKGSVAQTGVSPSNTHTFIHTDSFSTLHTSVSALCKLTPINSSPWLLLHRVFFEWSRSVKLTQHFNSTMIEHMQVCKNKTNEKHALLRCMC